MKDLLQISTATIGSENVNSVNARDIHEYLEVKTHLSTWIKRAIEKYDFEENIDFSILKSGNPNGGISIIDYIVTLDMAKELCMLENNIKGKETRKYFISFEKKAKNIISSQNVQIQLMQETLNQLSIADQRITKIESNLRIENWQQKRLEDVKNFKVYELAKKHDFKNDPSMIKTMHSRVWNRLKKKFAIPRYNELPICEFDNGISFIQKLTFAELI